MKTQPQEVIEVKGTHGAVDGYETTCACGLVMRNSTLSGIQLDAAAHLEWHRTQTVKVLDIRRG